TFDSKHEHMASM
ncbi:transketolase, partial [Vibrio parahaemolyticus VPTS-2010]